MRNLKLLSIALTVLLIASTVLAVSAEKHSFVILGRAAEGEGESGIIDEKIEFWANPGTKDMLQARIDSGIEVLVLEKREIEGEVFYIVVIVGKGGGASGWVSEDYIYEVTKEPPAPLE